MILDTSFLIDVQNAMPSALAKVSEIEAAGLPRRVPHIVIAELYVGVGKGTQTENNRQAIDRVLDGLDDVPITVEIAKKAGEVEGEIQGNRANGENYNGGGIGLPDAIIAVIANEFGEPVLTDNASDFETTTIDVEIEEY